MATIQPFRIEVPQADIDDVHNRLQRTRWADQIPGSGEEYGVGVDRVRALADYWLQLDWRKLEDRLNAHPQFVTAIDGQQIHFLHVRARDGAGFPLVLTHGWPGPSSNSWTSSSRSPTRRPDCPASTW